MSIEFNKFIHIFCKRVEVLFIKIRIILLVYTYFYIFLQYEINNTQLYSYKPNFLCANSNQ